MRTVLAAIAFSCLLVPPALAANAALDSAVKTFEQVPGDAAKLKIYCEMSKVMETNDPADEAAKKQVDGYMKQLGSEFETAYMVSEDLYEDSADGEAFKAALVALDAKCPK